MSDWVWDRLLIPFVTRVPGRFIAVTALVLYPGVGLVLPILLGLPNNWLFSFNMLAVSAAALLAIGYLFVVIEAKDRRHLLEWTTDLRLLTSSEFEYFVGELFRREGWQVTETGRQDGPDGNIDLVLRHGSDRRIVQCKRWRSWHVGVNEIRAFAGTLTRESAKTSDGIFVTLSDFSTQAEQEADKMGIVLMDRDALFRKVEKLRRPEPCPICQQPMLFDRSPRGWWFRCVAAGCSGKRDLGSDAGRAVSLLTELPHASTDPGLN
jgi:hypothetical protein